MAEQNGIPDFIPLDDAPQGPSSLFINNVVPGAPAPVRPKTETIEQQPFSFKADTIDAIAKGHYKAKQDSAINELAKVAEEDGRDAAGQIPDTYVMGPNMAGAGGTGVGMGFGTPIRITKADRIADRARRKSEAEASLAEAIDGLNRNTRKEPGSPNLANTIFGGVEPMAYALAPQVGLTVVDAASGGLTAPATIPARLAAAGGSGLIMGKHAYDATSADLIAQYGNSRGIDTTTPQGMAQAISLSMSDPTFREFRQSTANKVGTISTVGGTALGILPGVGQSLAKTAATKMGAAPLTAAIAGQTAGLGTAVTTGVGQQGAINVATGQPFTKDLLETGAMFGVQDLLFRTVHAAGGKAFDYYRSKMAGSGVGAPGAGQQSVPGGSGGASSGPSALNQWQLEALISKGMPATLTPEQQVAWIKSNKAKVKAAFRDLAAREDARRATSQEQAQPAPTAEATPAAKAGDTPDYIPLNDGPVIQSARDQASAGGNNIVPREALKPTRPGFELVEVDPKLINDEHQRSSPGQSIRTPGNELSRGDVTRTEQAKKYIQAGDYREAEPAELGFTEDGKLFFTNGRHRLKASEELGVKSVFVSVPKDQAKRISDQFGPKGMIESTRDEAPAVGNNLGVPDEVIIRGAYKMPKFAGDYEAWANDMIEDFGPEIEGKLPDIFDRALPIREKLDAYSGRMSQNIDKAGNLKARNNTREQTGLPVNPLVKLTDEAGKPYYVGSLGQNRGVDDGKPTNAFIEEIESFVEPKDMKRFFQWYELVAPQFIKQFGSLESPEAGIRMMTAWLAAQQNEGPSGALRNVFRKEDQLAGFKGFGEKGETLKAGLADEKVESILKDQVPEGGFGAKLTDFSFGSGTGRVTREYMGNDESAGSPFVADVWSGRDYGFIDSQTLNRLIEKAKDGKLSLAGLNGKDAGGKPVKITPSLVTVRRIDKTGAGKPKDNVVAAKVTPEEAKQYIAQIEAENNPKVSAKVVVQKVLVRSGRKSVELSADLTGSPAGGQYERASDWGNRVTKDLNTLGYQGRKWVPSEVQALGWMAKMKQYGESEATGSDAFTENTSRIAQNVDFSEGGLIASGNPEVASMSPQARAQIAKDVITTTANELAKVIGGSLRVTGVTEGQAITAEGMAPSVVISALGSPEAKNMFAAALALVGEHASVTTVEFGPGGKNSRTVHMAKADGSDFTPEEKQSLGALIGPGLSIHKFNGVETALITRETGKSMTEKGAENTLAKVQAWAEDNGVDLNADHVATAISHEENNWQSNKEGLPYQEAIVSRGGKSRLRAIIDYRQRYKAVVSEAVGRARSEGPVQSAQDKGPIQSARDDGPAERLVSRLRSEGSGLSEAELAAAGRLAGILGKHGYLDKMGLELRQAAPGGGVRGGYQPETNLVTIFVRAVNRPGLFADTFRHEVWHHLERMIPEKDLQAIKMEFLRERTKWLADKPGFRELLGDGDWFSKTFNPFAVDKLVKAGKLDKQLLEKFFIKSSYDGTWRLKRTDETYELMNTSEYLAERGTKLIGEEDAKANTQPIGAWARLKDLFVRIKDALIGSFGRSAVDKAWSNFKKGKYKSDFKREQMYAESEGFSARDKPAKSQRSVRDDGENMPIPGGYREAFLQAKKGAGAPEPKQIRWWTDLGHDPDADTTKQFLWAIDKTGQMRLISLDELNKMADTPWNNPNEDSEYQRVSTHLDWEELSGNGSLLMGPAHGRIDATGDVLRVSLIQKNQSTPEIKADMQRHVKEKLGEALGEDPMGLRGYDFTDAGPFTGPEVFSARDEGSQKLSIERAFPALDEDAGFVPFSSRAKSLIGKGYKLEVSNPDGIRPSVAIIDPEGKALAEVQIAIKTGKTGTQTISKKEEGFPDRGYTANLTAYKGTAVVRDQVKHDAALVGVFSEVLERLRQMGVTRVNFDTLDHGMRTVDLMAATTRITNAMDPEAEGDVGGLSGSRPIPNVDNVNINGNLFTALQVAARKPSPDAWIDGWTGTSDASYALDPKTAYSARDDEPSGNKFLDTDRLFLEVDGDVNSLYSPTAKKNLPAGSKIQFESLDEEYYASDNYGDPTGYSMTAIGKDGEILAEAQLVMDKDRVFTKRPKYLDGKIQRKQPKLEEGWAMTVEMLTGDNPRAMVAVAAEAVERAKMSGATALLLPFKGWDHREAVSDLIAKLDGDEDIQINDEIDAFNIVFKQNTPDYAEVEQGEAYFGIRRDQVYSSRDEEGDYRGSHRAPDGTAGEGSLDAMDRTYPEDIYGPKGAQYYGARRPDDAKIHKLIQSVRGNPDAMVTVYRAVPKGVATEITAGNWVTPSREYAAEHGDRFPGGFEILERKVRAGELFTEGNSLQEFGWNPTGESIQSARDEDGLKADPVVKGDPEADMRLPIAKRTATYPKGEAFTVEDADGGVEAYNMLGRNKASPERMRQIKEFVKDSGVKHALYRGQTGAYESPSTFLSADGLIHLTDDPNYAVTYSESPGKEIPEEGTKDAVAQVYLNAQNIADITSIGHSIYNMSTLRKLRGRTDTTGGEAANDMIYNRQDEIIKKIVSEVERINAGKLSAEESIDIRDKLWDVIDVATEEGNGYRTSGAIWQLFDSEVVKDLFDKYNVHAIKYLDSDQRTASGTHRGGKVSFALKDPSRIKAAFGGNDVNPNTGNIFQSARDEETASRPPALPEANIPKGGLIAAIAAMTPTAAEAATRAGQAAAATSTMDLVTAAAAIGLAGNDNLLAGLNPIVANMHLLARDTKSPTIKSVAEMFNRLGGNVPEGAQETYFDERDGNRRIFRNKLVKAFEPLASLSKEGLTALDQDLAAALAGEKTLTGAEGQVVDNLKNLSNELFDYLAGSGIKVNYAQDYGMPHSFDVPKLMQDEPAFLSAATRAYQLNNPMRIQRLTGYLQQVAQEAQAKGWTAELREREKAIQDEINELTGAKPAVQAQALLEAISTSNSGGDSTQGLLLEPKGTGQNKANFTRERIFEPAARQILREYFNNDPRHAWNGYIARATTLAEFARRFGGDGSKWTAMVKQMRAEQVSNKDITRIKNMVLDSLGVLNQAPTEGHALAVSILGLSNMAKLKSTALTNFLESQSQGIAGNISNTITAPIMMLGQFMAQVTELDARQQYLMKKYLRFTFDSETGSMELARAIGLMDAAGLHDIMENSAVNLDREADFSGATGTDKLARGVSRGTGNLARAYGIEASENAKRAVATRFAASRIDAHVAELLRDGLFARAFNSATSGMTNAPTNPFTLRNEARMRLRRAGVSDSEMAAFAQWWEASRAADFNDLVAGNDAMAKLARKVIRMEASRATVNTSRATKPGGKENALVSQDNFSGKLVMSFLNYPATFREQIAKPMARDIGTGFRGYESEAGQSTFYSPFERARMVSRMMAIPAMAVSAAVFLALRAWANGREDEVKKKPLWKHLVEGLTYTGIAGGKSEFASRVSRDQLPPILDEGNRFLRDINREDDKRNGKERAVARGAIRSAGVPLALGAVSTYMPVPVAVVLDQILASATFRDMATDFVAGKAAPKNTQEGRGQGRPDHSR